MVYSEDKVDRRFIELFKVQKADQKQIRMSQNYEMVDNVSELFNQKNH